MRPDWLNVSVSLRCGERITCPHGGLYWYADPAQERGWKCVDCDWQPGDPPGFSPEHDRSHLPTKVKCILNDLHEASIIYVSNGECGYRLADLVTLQCRARNHYDSVSIARAILEYEGSDDHAKFWRDVSDGILAGKDPRNRCRCGKLATAWTSGPGGGTYACSDHYSDHWEPT